MGTSTLEVRRDIERIRAELDQTLDQLGDHVRPSQIAKRRTRRMREGLQGVRQRIMGSTSHAASDAADGVRRAGDQMTEVTGEVTERARHAPEMVAESTRGNPLVAGVVAFGIGMLLGSLAPATEMEREAGAKLVEPLEPVKQKAMESAEALKSDVGDAAREGADHLQREAQSAARAVADTARESAGEVGERARAGADAVRDS
jgi:ElaB/YqjD/DUF883 family membrane-anchored ribosome-binding protein